MLFRSLSLFDCWRPMFMSAGRPGSRSKAHKKEKAFPGAQATLPPHDGSRLVVEGTIAMGKYLDLHDVAYGHPLAEKELRDLKENQRTELEKKYKSFWDWSSMVVKHKFLTRLRRGRKKKSCT